MLLPVQHHNVTVATQLAVSYSSHNCMTRLAGEQMSQTSMMLCAYPPATFSGRTWSAVWPFSLCQNKSSPWK